MHEIDVSLSEAWVLILEANLTILGEQSRPVRVGTTQRCHIAAGTLRDWRPRMEELHVEARQHRVGVSAGVEHAALLARTHHGVGNWIIQTDGV